MFFPIFWEYLENIHLMSHCWGFCLLGGVNELGFLLVAQAPLPNSPTSHPLAKQSEHQKMLCASPSRNTSVLFGGILIVLFLLLLFFTPAALSS